MYRPELPRTLRLRWLHVPEYQRWVKGWCPVSKACPSIPWPSITPMNDWKKLTWIVSSSRWLLLPQSRFWGQHQVIKDFYSPVHLVSFTFRRTKIRSKDGVYPSSLVCFRWIPSGKSETWLVERFEIWNPRMMPREIRRGACWHTWTLLQVLYHDQEIIEFLNYTWWTT